MLAQFAGEASSPPVLNASSQVSQYLALSRDKRIRQSTRYPSHPLVCRLLDVLLNLR
jgi:hypothetical protein